MSRLAVINWCWHLVVRLRDTQTPPLSVIDARRSSSHRSWLNCKCAHADDSDVSVTFSLWLCLNLDWKLICSHLSVHNCVCPPAPLKPRHYGAIEVLLLLYYYYYYLSPPNLESKSGSFPSSWSFLSRTSPAAIKIIIFGQNADVKMHCENWRYHQQNR